MVESSEIQPIPVHFGTDAVRRILKSNDTTYNTI